MLWMRPALLSGFGLSFVLAKLENEAGYSDEAPDFDRVSEGMEIYYYLFTARLYCRPFWPCIKCFGTGRKLRRNKRSRK